MIVQGECNAKENLISVHCRAAAYLRLFQCKDKQKGHNGKMFPPKRRCQTGEKGTPLRQLGNALPPRMRTTKKAATSSNRSNGHQL